MEKGTRRWFGVRWAAIGLPLALAAFAAGAGERVLGTVALADSSTRIELLESEAGGDARPTRLKLKIASAEGGAAIELATPGFPAGKGLRADRPLHALALELGAGGTGTGESRPLGTLVTFALDDGEGSTRAVAAAIVKSADKWVLANEWSVDSAAEGAMSYKRETQSFAGGKPGTLTRQTHRLSVEGMTDKLGCGCLVCQSRTLEISEDETYAWNAKSAAFERTRYEKHYVVQPGEGLMAVARKALGDARLMSRLVTLNPDLKSSTFLKEGRKLLVEVQAKP